MAEKLHERVVDIVLYQEAGAGEADLAAVVEHDGGLLGGGVEVGVVQDNEGTLAAEFGGEGNEVLGGFLANNATSLGRSGEGDATNAGIAHQRSANFFAQALHDIEDTRWEAGFVNEVHQQRAAERRPLGRLQDDGITGRERWCALPGREHEGCVPRGDDDGGAGRQTVHGIRGAVRGPLTGFVVASQLGVGAEVAGSATDHPKSQTLFEHGHVEAFHVGDALDVGVNEVSQPVEVVASALDPEGGPARKGGHGCGHRKVSLLGATASDVGQLPVPVEWGTVFEG